MTEFETELGGDHTLSRPPEIATLSLLLTPSRLLVALTLVLSVSVSCVAHPRGSPRQFTLVQRGKAQATIVVPENGMPNELRAASELATYLGKMSGAELSVATELKAGYLYPIYVGNTKAFARERLVIPRNALSGEGFVVIAKARGLFLAGSNDQCTLYAVYDFLETLGCRFYFPGEVGEVVPRQETIRIPSLRIAEKPAMASREFWIWGYKVRSRYEGQKLVGFTAPVVAAIPDEKLYAAIRDWAIKNKAGGALVYCAHNWSRILLPPKVFFESYPDYYSLVKGRRESYQLCSTNLNVIRHYIEASNLFFDQHPQFLAYSLSPNDGPVTCECDNCRALDDPTRPGDHGRRLAVFVNSVAQAVKQTHPDKYLTYLATYTDDLRSPPTDVRMEKNVIAMVVNDPRYVKEWAEKGVIPAFYLWVFEPTTTRFPLVDNLSTAPEAVRQAHLGGAQVVLEEVNHSPLNYPAVYLSMKVSWDGDLDLDAARRQLLSDYFGPAAGDMERFWKTLGQVKGVADLDRWGRHLEEALKQAKGEQPYAARIEQIQPIYRIVRHYLLLESLALATLQTGRKEDKDQFMASFIELSSTLDSEAGRALPNRDVLRVRMKDVFGGLAGARPRYTDMQAPGDFLWGDFDYKVDGLMRAAEAVRLQNIVVSPKRLGVAPRSQGSIEWEFRAPAGAVFHRSEAVWLCIIPASDNAEVVFEVSTDAGQTWKTAHKSARPEPPILLTPFVLGAKSFLLRVGAANKADAPWNFLEDLRIELSAR